MYTSKIEDNGLIFDIILPKKYKYNLIIILPGLPEYPLPKELMFKLAEEGYGVLYPRYKGTYESNGNFLNESPAEDILKLIDSLKKKKEFKELYGRTKVNIDFEKLFVLASSFGSSVALHLSKLTKDIDRFILIAPVIDFKKHGQRYEEQDLVSLKEFLIKGYPFLYRFDEKNYDRLLDGQIIPSAIENIGDYSGEIILLHSKEDSTISIENSKEFSKKCSKIKFLEINQAGHFSVSKLNWDILKKCLKNEY